MMADSHSARARSAAQERHPHLGQEPEEGWVRVDCHSHSMWSGDCTTTPDELAVAIEASGIDVLCLTDHNVIAGARQLAGELPCRVIIGEEMRVGGGELIGLFLSERVPQGLGPIESAKRIRDQGGLVYIPHPFDPMRNCLRPDEIDLLVANDLVDAIEGKNAKTSLDSLNQEAVDYGHQHGLMVGAGSDAHVPEAIGSTYLVMPDFDTPASFLASMAQGRIVGHHFDEPRPWSARIVPSVDDPIAT